MDEMKYSIRGWGWGLGPGWGYRAGAKQGRHLGQSKGPPFARTGAGRSTSTLRSPAPSGSRQSSSVSSAPDAGSGGIRAERARVLRLTAPPTGPVSADSAMVGCGCGLRGRRGQRRAMGTARRSAILHQPAAGAGAGRPASKQRFWATARRHTTGEERLVPFARAVVGVVGVMVGGGLCADGGGTAAPCPRYIQSLSCCSQVTRPALRLVSFILRSRGSRSQWPHRSRRPTRKQVELGMM